MKLAIERISGEPSDDAISEAFSKRINLDDGDIITVASCVQIHGVGDLSVFGQDVFEIFCKRLEEMNEGVLDALRIARDAVGEYLNNRDFELNWATVVFYSDAVYFARSDKKIKIFVYSKEGSGEITFDDGSGLVKPGQVYALFTEKFQSHFNQSSFEAQQLDFEGTLDGIATEISSQDKQGELGAVFVLSNDDEKKWEDEASQADALVEAKESEEVEEQTAEPLVQPQQMPEKQEIPATSKKTVNLNLGGFFKQILREITKLRQGEMGAMSRLRKRVVLAALVILILLAGSVAFAFYSNSSKANNALFSEHLSDATSKYNEAISLMDLNRSKARDLLIAANSDIDQALSIDKKNSEANKLKTDISSKLKETEAAGAIKFETLADLDSGAVGISTDGKNLILASRSKLYQMPSGSNKLSEITSLDNAVAVSYWSKGEFILLDDKVVKVDLQTNKVQSVASGISGQDLDIFFGNVYVLGKDQITKLIAIENGYSPSDYLSSKVNFGTSAHMSIDKSIWVTFGNKILKFTRGQAENFQVSGIVANSYNFGPIFTNADSDNLYVVDSLNSALLVIDKNGVFKKSYQAAEFAKAVDILVDESAAKMYVAVGNKVLTAPL